MAIFGISINKSRAQIVCGQTYVVNGQPDLVAPVDTFFNLMGPATGTNIGAISFLNQFGVSGNGTATLLLAPGYSGNEPAAINIGNATGQLGIPNMFSVGREIIMRPVANFNVTITTTAAIPANGALVRFNGAWNFTIDGSGTTGQRNLTFNMGSNSNLNTRVIDISPLSNQGVQGIAVRNCNIYGNSTSNAINTYAGIYVGGPNTTPQAVLRGRNERITFENNYIVAVRNGIYYRGLANTINNQDRFVTIRNNIIGDNVHQLNSSLTARVGGAPSSAGIYVNTVAQSTIEGNTVRFCLDNSQNFAAILLTHEGGIANTSTDSAIRVERNTIHDLEVNQAGGVYGVRINLGAHPGKRLDILVANNSIRNLQCTQAQTVVQSFIYPVGILVENSTDNAGIEIFYNTVIMSGNSLPNNAVSANVGIAASVTGGIVFMNNMLSNTMGRSTTNTTGFFTYNVVLAGTVNPFLYSSFNNYHNITTDGGYHYVARANNIDYASLKSYRTYSVSDSSSWSAIPPPYNSTSVATIANGISHRTWNRGVDIAQFWRFYPTIFNAIQYKVSNDILGNNRNNLGRFASIGCHQWNGDSTNFNIALIAPRTFAINGTNNFPTLTNLNGSFANISSAIEYLNSYGIGGSGNVVLEVQSGYTGEPGYLPLLNDYLGSSASSTVTFRTASGVTANITIPNAQNLNNSALLRLMGCKWVTFDGGNNRGFVFSLPANSTNTNSRIIAITPTDVPTQRVTLRNCIIRGNSNTSIPNTQFGVYIGAPITGGVPLVSLVQGISNITIQGCIIEAVRTGIYARVPGNSQELYIRNNIIGGTTPPATTSPTTFLGGVADQAGVFVKGYTDVEIDSNVIRNCVSTASVSNGFRGIDLDEPGSNNFLNINVSRNFIYNLVTLTGNYTHGIRVLLSNVDTVNTRNIFIQNNFIGQIIGNGAGSAFSTFNPHGIVIDAAGIMPRPGISIAHNTINLTGLGLGLANSASSALFLGANIRGGIGIVNNIFANQMNRTTAGNKYAVLVGHNVSPFNGQNTLLPFGTNNNNYFVTGAGTNFIGGNTGATVNRLNINEWRLFTTTAGNNSDNNSFSWPIRFLNDTTPNFDMVTAGLVPNGAAFLSLVCNDIYGNARFQCAGSNTSGRWVGALEQGATFPALQGGQTYQINGVQSPPTQGNPGVGSFRTVRAAVEYLNSQGVDGTFGGVRPIRLEISTGYVGETDSFTTPITISDYPRQNANRPVILSVAAGQNHTISYTGPTINAINIPNASFIRFSGSQHFTIDGSNNSTTSRNLTIIPPAAFTQATNKVIDFISGAATIQATNPATSNNTIRNCVIRGNSTTSSNLNFAAIYMGGLTTPSNATIGLNNNNTFRNNEIGAVQYGIYLRGTNTRGLQDFGNVIADNEIGGNVAPGGSAPTTYFGGISGSAGISIIAQANTAITNNTIKNNIQSDAQPRGIELQTISGQNTVLDSNIAINGNNIYNIITTQATGAYGIYINFLNDLNNLNRNIRITNNMISGIRSVGTNRASTFNQNPFGIFIDATAVMVQNLTNNNNTNIRILYNSINLGSAGSLTTSQAISACVGIDSRIRGGVSMWNNLFQNNLPGNNANQRATAVAVGGTFNPFAENKNNNYFSNPTGTIGRANFITNASVATPTGLDTWDQIMAFTGDDTLSITFAVPFLNDTVLNIVSGSSVFHGNARPTSLVLVDRFGTARNPFEPSMGAHEFTGTYNDILIPRIFNVTEPSNCNPGFALLNFRIYDRLLTRDTMYYRINGGAITAIQSFSGSGVERNYIIPNIPNGALVEYRVSARDFTNNNGLFPIGKLWDTINTNINVYPYSTSFEGVISPAWTVQTISGNATWDLSAPGSNANPPIGPRTGIRAALFRSENFTNGATARLVSPCFDFSNTVSPTLRFFMSQNSDVPTKLDSVVVRVSAGGGFWSNPIRNIRRVNAGFNFPGYQLVEVCLSEYNGFGSIRIGIDGVSSGNGQNIVIDDITVYDDAQTQALSPKTFPQCFRDVINLNIPNSSTSHRYDVVDVQTSDVVATGTGNGGNLNLAFLPADRPTFRVIVNATNLNSFAIRSGFGSPFVTCSNVMPDTITATVNRYTNGPFIVPGSTFSGSFNGGGAFDPDGARVGDTLIYQINPPGGFTNAQYGTMWTITQVTVRTQSNNVMPGTVFTPPSGSNAGTLRIQPTQGTLDSTYFVSFFFRLIPSNCDSLVQRVLRIATPPAANFVNQPTNNACALTPIAFQSVSTLIPENFPYTYLWLFGDNTTSTVVNPSKTYQTPGTYNVRLIVTDRFGLTSQFVRSITVLPAPNVNFTFNVPCAGDSTVFTPATQPAGSVFEWTFPGNKIDTREIGRFSFANFDQSYNVSLKITNAQGCANTTTRSLFVFAKPKARFFSTPHCLANNVPIRDSSSIANNNALGYTWIWGNGQTSLGPNPVYKYPASGTYNATLRLSSSFGCVDSMVVPITVFDKPNANFTFSNACFGDQINLNNTSTFVGGAQNLNYIWDFGDNTFSTDRVPNKAFASTGNFNVRLTAFETLNGCRDSILIPIRVNYKPVAQFNSASTVCERSPLALFTNSYTIDQIPFTCLWQFGNGDTSTNCGLSSYTYMAHNNYTLRLIVSAGGCRDTATRNILVNVSPTLTVTTERVETTNPSFFYGQNKVKFTPSITNGIDYTWRFGDALGSTSKQVSPTFTYNNKGTYKVRVRIQDQGGCIVEDSLDVQIFATVGVQEELASKFELNAYPNPFSNNANVKFTLDKSNDVTITVTDLLGRVIKTNNYGKLAIGSHNINLDENNFGAAGTYMIKVTIGETEIYRPLIKQ
ncbi:MAG: PKD domain-containing protein [Bacteroidia bacterium]